MMTESDVNPLSRTGVDKAGNVLRRANPEIHAVRSKESWTNEGIVFRPRVTAEFSIDRSQVGSLRAIETALGAALMFREGVGIAMQLVHRSIAGGLSEFDAAVASRHKRMQAILDKLQRFPHMRLSQMDDIAGCRVVVREQSQVSIVRDALGAGFDIRDVDDYVTKPKQVGYRALHVILCVPDTNIVMSDGSRDSLVEVQIRTVRQNEWADQIEAATGTTGFDLKGGDITGLPEDLVEYVRTASDIRALADAGKPTDNGLEARLAELREVVRPYFSN